MSNLETAKAAIEAEINHVKQGLAFYHSRIESLEKTLLQLSTIGAGSSDAPGETTPTPAKRGPKPGAKKAAKLGKAAKSAASANPEIAEKSVKPAKKTKGTKAAGQELPSTGKDFWPNLVTEQPKSFAEILEGAIANIGFTPNPVLKQKLAGRMTFAINALVKSKAIQDSGKGRERRFFKA